MSGKYNNTTKTITCSVSNDCGGCCYTGIPYDKTLEIKEKKVNELFKGIYTTKRIVGMFHPINYRNKVHGVVGSGAGGSVITGCYREESHDIIPVDYCMIQDKKADEIISTLRELFSSFRYRPYNEDTGNGFMRHVLIRRGFSTDEIMVVLVTSNVEFPSKNNFIAELLKLHPGITTIIQNINNYNTSMVLGKKNIVLHGKGYIEDILCKNRFRIGPDSFYQINPSQTEKLYKAAINGASISKDDVVFDAYCGIGTIGITAAKHCKSVIGVELNPNAVKDAKINAKINGINNINFVCQDATEFLSENAGKIKADVIIMDPPRSGSTEVFLSSVLKVNPSRVVYISCNPETQARDIKTLIKGGYRITDMETYDMFPYTDNIENIVCMVKE